MTKRPLNFATAQERQDWIIQHANHFTTVRRLNMVVAKQEHKTIDEARAHAKKMVEANGTKPVLIYAVNGNSDTYVEMVKP
jgi:hypothetical protein